MKKKSKLNQIDNDIAKPAAGSAESIFFGAAKSLPPAEACDLVIERALAMMLFELEASPSVVLDRMFSQAIGRACMIDGSPRTAAMLHTVARKVAAGLFHPITGEDIPGEKRH